MDRRGREASGDSLPHDAMREAEDVAAVVDAISGPVSVLGHSYGAICSLEAALLTGQIRHLILYEPPILTGREQYPPGVPARINALIEQGELEAALEVFLREVVRMLDYEFEAYRQLPTWQARIPVAPTIPRETFELSYTFDGEKLAGLSVPTCLLLGGDSASRVREETRVVRGALPNSQIVLLPGEQHIAMDRNPELFVAKVLRCLQE
jgi:pimeloyl-ACP methyl ester carboxylesterase